MRLPGTLALALALMLCGLAAPAVATPPPIKHVWVIVLENKDFEDSFGPDTEAPFLARELTRRGELLTQYFGTSHASLGNYITMVSGQAPNAATQGDCPVWTDVFPGVPTPDGQVLGSGCVFPATTKTIADQLDSKSLRWRGYMEDMGNTPGEPTTCRHPAIGEADDTEAAREQDQYAARHNPFVYFHSVIDSPTCARNVVPLDQLTQDIRSADTTPNFAFITPDLCNDGHDASCADGGLGGLPASDAFLQKWVPRILASPGFAQSGLLVITWDEANIDPDSSTACCNQPTGPNTPSPGIAGPGGGRTGTVLISPFVKPGSVVNTPYNHYGLLRSIQEIFGLGPLGYSGLAGLRSFGSDVYNAPTPAPPPPARPACRPARTGPMVAALRLRARLLTFRARRTGRIAITARVGKRNASVRRLRRVVACHRYQALLPSNVKSVTVRGAGRTQRVKRGPSGEHDAKRS